MDASMIKLSKREIEVCNLLLTGNCTNKIAELCFNYQEIYF